MRQTYPEARIVFVSTQAHAPLLAQIEAVDEVLTSSVYHPITYGEGEQTLGLVQR